MLRRMAPLVTVVACVTALAGHVTAVRAASGESAALPAAACGVDARRRARQRGGDRGDRTGGLRHVAAGSADRAGRSAQRAFGGRAAAVHRPRRVAARRRPQWKSGAPPTARRSPGCGSASTAPPPTACARAATSSWSRSIAPRRVAAATAAVVRAAATELRAVRASRSGDEVTVAIVGNGPLTATTVEEAKDMPPRVLLDFAGRGRRPRRAGRRWASIRPTSTRVRVATNSRDPLVTRVVVDLKRRLEYRVEAGGRRRRGSACRVRGRRAAPAVTARADPPPAPVAAAAALARAVVTPTAPVRGGAGSSARRRLPRSPSGVRRSRRRRAGAGGGRRELQARDAGRAGRRPNRRARASPATRCRSTSRAPTCAPCCAPSRRSAASTSSSTRASTAPSTCRCATCRGIRRSTSSSSPTSSATSSTAPSSGSRRWRCWPTRKSQRRKLADEQALAGELRVLTRPLSYAKGGDLVAHPDAQRAVVARRGAGGSAHQHGDHPRPAGAPGRRRRTARRRSTCRSRRWRSKRASCRRRATSPATSACSGA